MRYLTWGLVALALLMAIVQALRHREASAHSWAWVTIGLFVLAVIIQILTEPCNECFTTGRPKQEDSRELEASNTYEGHWRPVQQSYADLQALSRDIPPVQGDEAHRLR